jgi:hypothetical protein
MEAVDYIGRMKGISGWLSRENARVLIFLDAFQKSRGIRGDLFEIGVHHGKSAILLGLLASGGEKLKVNDIFDAGQNTSKSGEGDEAAKDTGTRCRLFHIDGGHSVAETYSDLATAKRAVRKGGIIVIDDFFNHSWPEVTEGIQKFLSANRDMAPLLACTNKLYIVRRGDHKAYWGAIHAKEFRQCFPSRTHKYEFHDRRLFSSDTLFVEKFNAMKFRAHNLLHTTVWRFKK